VGVYPVAPRRERVGVDRGRRRVPRKHCPDAGNLGPGCLTGIYSRFFLNRKGLVQPKLIATG
jgi:hypothetical protein